MLTTDCSYVLFSIGNVTPLLESAFPACWDDHTICDATWIEAIAYLEVVGIIIGQILVGLLGDWLGRRWGLIQDAVIMFIGLVMLSAAWGVTESSSPEISVQKKQETDCSQMVGLLATPSLSSGTE